MLTDTPSWSKSEIGGVLVNLRAVCYSCSKNPDHNLSCEIAKDCSIGVARTVLLDFVSTNEQVLKDFDVAVIPNPGAITFDKRMIEESFEVIHNLCQRCMFHADRCFLNITYRMLEAVLGRSPLKKLNVRPGDTPL
jgi:hypothetical protein